ncbi:hypothetical protein FGB62_66g130 [Gracilaria domingensis]|nr:hypothetical protein FGB62_66g130 [Gracilaria domingensis]
MADSVKTQFSIAANGKPHKAWPGASIRHGAYGGLHDGAQREHGGAVGQTAAQDGGAAERVGDRRIGADAGGTADGGARVPVELTLARLAAAQQRGRAVRVLFACWARAGRVLGACRRRAPIQTGIQPFSLQARLARRMIRVHRAVVALLNQLL